MLITRGDRSDANVLRNGALAAAILAAGAGCCTMGVLYVIGVASPQALAWMAFYKPSGALSGQSSITIFVWGAIWIALDRMWSQRNVVLKRVIPLAYLLLAIGVILTFPPIARLF